MLSVLFKSSCLDESYSHRFPKEGSSSSAQEAEWHFQNDLRVLVVADLKTDLTQMKVCLCSEQQKSLSFHQESDPFTKCLDGLFEGPLPYNRAFHGRHTP